MKIKVEKTEVIGDKLVKILLFISMIISSFATGHIFTSILGIVCIIMNVYDLIVIANREGEKE